MAHQQSSGRPGGGFKARAKTTLSGGGVGLLLGLILAGWAWFEGRGALTAAQEVCSVRLEAAAEQAAQHQSALASATATGRLQQARILLARAVEDLDRRNFGTANDRVDQAAALLAQVDAAAAQVEAAPLAQVRDVLAALDIRVAADPGDQRAALLAQATQLDLLLQR